MERMRPGGGARPRPAAALGRSCSAARERLHLGSRRRSGEKEARGSSLSSNVFGNNDDFQFVYQSCAIDPAKGLWVSMRVDSLVHTSRFSIVGPMLRANDTDTARNAMLRIDTSGTLLMPWRPTDLDHVHRRGHAHRRRVVRRKTTDSTP